MSRPFSINHATTRYNLMLGLFLKLLAFFIILYIYADIDPIKLRQAETSVRDQFNIDVSLSLSTTGVTQSQDLHVTETAGYSLQSIDTALRTEFDMLSTRFDRVSETMILRLPADIPMAVQGRMAKSPSFAEIFVHTLNTHKNKKFAYQVELIAISDARDTKNVDALMRSISILVQQMQSYGYSEDLLSIGYEQETIKAPVLEIRIRPISASQNMTGDAS